MDDNVFNRQLWYIEFMGKGKLNNLPFKLKKVLKNMISRHNFSVIRWLMHNNKTKNKDKSYIQFFYVIK